MIVQKKSVCEGESKVERQVDCDVGPQKFVNAAFYELMKNQISDFHILTFPNKQ